MPIDLCIDASFFTWESKEDDESDISFENYIRTILEVDTLLELPFLRFFCSDAVKFCLYNSGLFPFYDSISKAIAASGLTDIYQTSDIVRLLDRLVERSIEFESELNISTILFNVHQSTMPFRTEARIGEVQLLQLVYAGIASQRQKAFTSQSLFLGRNEQNPLDQLSFLSATTEIQDIDPIDAIEQPLPFQIQFETSALTSPKLFFNKDMWEHILTCHIDGPEELVQAFNLYVKECSDTPQMKYRIGDNFYEGMQDLNLLNNQAIARSLFNSMVDVISRTREAQCHPLRTGNGGNNPQRMQGPWFAWRKDVDREYHLHYWSYNNTVEFADVVTHNNFSISPCKI